MLRRMAGPTGFEPATSRLTIWRPNLAERRPLQDTLFDGNTSATQTRWASVREATLLTLAPSRGKFHTTSDPAGRRNRDRTCDLCLVRAALSRLSYPPENPSVARQLCMLSSQPGLVNRTSTRGTRETTLKRTRGGRSYDRLAEGRRRRFLGKRSVCSRFSRSRSTCV